MTTALCSLTVDEYDRLIAAGAFAPEAHLELIEGELRPLAPLGPLHEVAVDLLTEWSIRQIGQAPIRVRVQNSIGLSGLESAPEPDVVWVHRGDYRRRRPQSTDVLLVIEVADSSGGFDRQTKGPLYARAGIPDYWLVNLPEFTVEVYRRPSPGGYGECQTAGVDDALSPLALPTASLSIGWLFGLQE